MRTPTPGAHGVPIGSLAGTRVLKAHVEAARTVVAQVLEDMGPTDTAISTEAAESIAAAILTAEDGNRGPEYVIALRTARNDLHLFGRYRTYRAATKARDRGLPFTGRTAILPLIPYPRKDPK